MSRFIVGFDSEEREYTINGVRYIVENRYEPINFRNISQNTDLGNALKAILLVLSQICRPRRRMVKLTQNMCVRLPKRRSTMQPKMNEPIGITAIYCRLSRGDGMDGDSNSVANQKRLLSQKAKELGLSNTKYYVDDGYTGTNFNRPGFQQMLSDIELGYVTVVMVKDLSRLGRDYVSVGNYTDSYFPDHGTEDPFPAGILRRCDQIQDLFQVLQK